MPVLTLLIILEFRNNRKLKASVIDFGQRHKSKDNH